MEDQFFGPYLAERQWGTVREDHSSSGNCWDYISHHDSLNAVYLHGEDGLFGWSDKKARLCSSLALWNGKDPILKERLFGLTGPEGNHGEDVKELYYYLSNLPNHNYMKALYQYPQKNFPYNMLIKQNKKRCHKQPEYEITDTGVFQTGYWDIYMEFAKEDPRSCLCRYTIHNRGKEKAELYVLPQVWFRDTWSHNSCDTCHTFTKPTLKKYHGSKILLDYSEGTFCAAFDHDSWGKYPSLLFTENDSQSSSFTKDAFHRYIVSNESTSVNPDLQGTKCGALYILSINPGDSETIQWCLYPQDSVVKCNKFSRKFDEIINLRKKNAEDFYSGILNPHWNYEERNIARQAYAGLLWNKQFYCYDVRKWIESIGSQLSGHSSKSRPSGNWTIPLRNRNWIHNLKNCDIISMPDKWEFPWYAAWDLAFQMIPFATLDPEFAQKQLLLLLSDEYLHSNGQIPACEFDFSDSNPPIHCWACLSVYHKTKLRDVSFLKKCFHRLLLNYNWWENTNKIACPGHLYSGGFLGMDNISVYNRSGPLPKGYILAQVDATAWMAFYSIKMFEIAIELSYHDKDYSDMALRFLKHFLLIAEYSSQAIHKGGFWHEEDKFFYDILISTDSGPKLPLCIRSLVGLIPLIAVSVTDISPIKLNNPDLYKTLHQIAFNSSKAEMKDNRLFLSFVSSDQLHYLLKYVFHEEEFLSRFGIRSLSKYHKDNPYRGPIRTCCRTYSECHMKCATIQNTKTSFSDREYSDNESSDEDDMKCNSNQDLYTNTLYYSPGESPTNMFGGNSNWRGPIWLCMNYLLHECFGIYYKAFGNNYTLEYPTGHNEKKNLQAIRKEISKRILDIFLPNTNGSRPLHGSKKLYEQSNLQNLVLFYEYFNADSGEGCGASHQTGWSSLIVEFIKDLHS
ncbi:uncharacterized protein YMR196W-like [Argonauta hians]